MNRFERFCQRNERYGIKNLMTIIVAGQGALGLLSLFLGLSNQAAQLSFLEFVAFIPEAFLRGEVWRLVTFIFFPETFGGGLGLIGAALTLFFYFWIGRSLEAAWGRMKLTVYYFSGLLITVVFSVLTNTIGSLLYLNLSLFFALATLMPNEYIRLMMLIPIKMKYLALAEAAIFIVLPVFSWVFSPPFRLDNLIPLLSVLNYLIFFRRSLWSLVRRTPANVKASRRTVQFKSEVRRAKSQRGYIHKCTVCGRTDTDLPDMEFRYCSLCVGYACYCADHIFDHVHRTLQ